MSGKICYSVKTKSGEQFEFEFTSDNYSSKSLDELNLNRSSLMPSSIKLIDPQASTKVHWAILQTYNIIAGGINSRMIIDGPAFQQKCGSNQHRPSNLPPYCETYSTHPFFDRPTYDCPSDGKIIFYTFLTEMEGDDPNNESSYLSCKYHCSAGFIWGLHRTDSNVRSLPVEQMTNSEVNNCLEVFRREYPNASFTGQ